MVAKSNKNRTLLSSSVSMGVIALFAISGNAFAQETKTKANETIVVTGSSIKRKVLDSALPLQIITQEELKREGISSAEQMTMLLTANGTGTDNLASQTDVSASGSPSRGFNGASTANLRGQGSNATLILLNGRRIASHGLKGFAVDLNQIPMSAIERVDVLKDGASAVYGTDAVGGVINFITKKSYKGLNLQGFADVTEDGGGNIYRSTILGGIGDLDDDNYNIWATLSYTKNEALMASQRDFVNTYQPDRGISIDTRGTPFANIVTFANSFLTSSNAPASGGLNVLRLPNGAGCNSVDRMNNYQAVLWNASGNTLVCDYDTGKAAALQQPIEKYNLVSKASYRFGEHTLSAEVLASKSTADKIYSEVQISTASSFPVLYGMNANSQSTYDSLYNKIVAAYPSLGTPSTQYGKGFAFRWRCLECGPRVVETETKTQRIFVGLDGPLAAGWNYSTGASYSSSEADSYLKSGFYYSNKDTTLGINAGLADLISSGLLNPFLTTGQSQSAAGLAGLASASASGRKAYGGKFELKQIDGTVSGPLFDLWGGMAYAALGFDLRNEVYTIGGTDAPAPVFSSPATENIKITSKERNVNALFAEVSLPVLPKTEINIAGRYDSYDGFGSVFNPKISGKYKAFDSLLFRASYGTGFMVPSFDKLYDVSDNQPYGGNDIVDPSKCPTLVVSTGNCAGVQNLRILSGGNASLEPEKSKQYSAGLVFEPVKDYSLTLDWWKIERTGTVQTLTITQLLNNYNLFTDKFVRDNLGNLVAIDRRYLNAGGTLTEGVDVSLRGRGTLMDGKWFMAMEGTYLIDKRSKVLASQPWGPSEVGKYVVWGDLGLKWKHNISFTYSKGDWSGSLSQLYRASYKDQVLPGVASGAYTASNIQEDVDAYITYNASLTYKGFKNFTITGGIKNLLNTDPPFAIAYDTNTGAGSSWEPRVADPRGRAFTLLLDYKF